MADRYREALEAIVAYESGHVTWEHSDPDCAGCARARKREWPPSRLCDKHYSEGAAVADNNEKEHNRMGYRLKRIARDALEADDADK